MLKDGHVLQKENVWSPNICTKLPILKQTELFTILSINNILFVLITFNCRPFVHDCYYTLPISIRFFDTSIFCFTSILVLLDNANNKRLKMIKSNL